MIPLIPSNVLDAVGANVLVPCNFMVSFGLVDVNEFLSFFYFASTSIANHSSSLHLPQT